MNMNRKTDDSNLIRTETSAYSKKTNLVMSILFVILSIIVFLPILLVFIVSVSSEASLNELGYSFFPKELTLDGYRYLLRTGGYILRSFFNSVLITAAGTVTGLLLMCPLAYALSRKEFNLRKPILIFLMIPMLFSGGLVSSYMVNTQIFHLQNNYLALILPGLCSTWFIMILRNYFQTSVPDSLIEAAELDGCGHFRILMLIMVPVARPVIMTVAVFLMFSYWSSWYPSLLYLDSNHTELYPLQYVLVNMDRSIETMSHDAQYMSGMETYTPPAVMVRMVMVVIVILPVIILLPFFQKFLKNGLTVGAVKG